jgi:hypothetical protein
MFANDLLQNQLSLGAYSGAMNPFTSPYAGSIQPAINPLANPFAGVTQSISPFVQQAYGGVPNYAAIAQQQQLQQQQLQQQLQQQVQEIQRLQTLASILASQGANPQMLGLSQQNNPYQNQPFQNQPFQNQLWQTQQPNLLPNPLIAASLQNPLINPVLAQQLAQQQNPFAQTAFPLAPQSWVGQQFNPHHHQLAGRGIY